MPKLQSGSLGDAQQYFTSTHIRWRIVLFSSAIIPASTWCFRWTEQKKSKKGN